MPEQRKARRQEKALPIIKELYAWLSARLLTVSKKSVLWKAISYATTRWTALTRYTDNGAIEIDNNAAERSLRAVAMGRNYLRSVIMRSTARTAAWGAAERTVNFA